MVLVDTCVWSAALRRRNAESVPKEAILLQRLIRQHRAVMIGPILQEVLTGIKHEAQFTRLCDKLSAFELLPISEMDYISAATQANICRRHGVQGSHTDFLIATMAIKHQIPVLTTDKDFIHYRKHIPVVLYR
ncbi:PIN domain-containing protein [Endozoicomonas sp. SCSIO W0465]|uniref:type II toxin-antitoxin system VapC family toxin n=1 Tax=Endozoicomonas sp. SCSIO W0465 TaxID=2918516 RepID=UPI002074C98E|nr:PIN domain-containing protein [Endozoicomonas sp. SCSIO W0465]USE35199.1 PIN domain-containing protein [Endozoicomonas sp. SCSIO W0465]